MKKRIDAREKDQDEKNRAQQKLMVLLVQSTRASIALGEATAHAMQRGHTNGDMEAALEYAANVKHEQKQFLDEQGIHNLFDEWKENCTWNCLLLSPSSASWWR